MTGKRLNFIAMCAFAAMLLAGYAEAAYGFYDDPESQCSGERWWECTATVTAKIDADCDGIPDSVVVKHYNGKHFANGVIRIFDQKGAYKDSLMITSNGSSFLGVIQLPFDPAKDSGGVCSKKILDLVYSKGIYNEGRLYGNEMSVKPGGLGQIKYIIKNSIKKAPGPWMDIADIDTSFKGYAGVMSQADFRALGIKLPEWTESYCSDGSEDNSEFTRNSKGLLISYYAHNHLMLPKYSLPDKEPQKTFLKIPVSDGVVIYQTAHGVLLRKGNRARWVYFTDVWQRLRWTSVDKVTVSNGRINLFLGRGNDGWDEEEYGKEPKPDLHFSLKELLK